MKKMVLAFASLIMCAACANAATDSICQELEGTIDDSIRSIALSLSEGDINDRGAPQQTVRYISINGKLQVIQINLLLESENKCPVRKTPINPFGFNRLDVSKCQLALLGGEGKENSAALCNIKNWKTN